jgi:flagellar protein FlgJ
MRNADFNTAAMTATAPTAATRPTAGMGGGGARNSAASSAPCRTKSARLHPERRRRHLRRRQRAALSPEGSLWQARASQAANAIVGDSGEPRPTSRLSWKASHPGRKEAADKLGVAPELVSAHAALESGWGQRPLKNGDGSSTHNLFGIKAGASWHGALPNPPPPNTSAARRSRRVRASAPIRTRPAPSATMRRC